MGEIITVKCYGKEEIWNDRNAALEFYFEAFMGSDGSEKERYGIIMEKLHLGMGYCSDED